jgi:signal peptidase I
LVFGKGTSSTLQKWTTKIPKEIKLVVVAVVAILAVWFVLTTILAMAFNVANPYYVVQSESMTPTFKKGDLVIIRNDLGFGSFHDVKIGDVIVFFTHDPEFIEEGSVVMHRVVTMYRDLDGNKVLVTKGDANQIPEPLLDYPIREQDYKGKVAYHIPYVALPRTWFQNFNTTDTLPSPEQLREMT